MALRGSKMFALITGPSRGIGREIAVQLSKIAGKGSAFLLTARTLRHMEDLKVELQKNNDGLEVFIVACDAEQLNAGKMIEFESTISAILETSKKFDTLLLVHNAGTVGDVSKPGVEMLDMKEWHDYLQINLVSAILLNNLVLRTITEEVAPKRYVVNVTSLMAVKSFPSFTQYAVGKAGREAFFRSLAVENPSLRVLNYSPGPVQTDMLNEIAKKSFDASTRESFKKPTGESELIPKALMPEETVIRLLQILEEDKFETGSRCDYFD